MLEMNYYPLVSVIVPVYNVEDYLERCVASITNQTFDNLEIILVDDGSTDSSGALCDQLAAADNRIRVLHSENRGLSGARNLGLKHIHGDWIVYIDSDDYIGECYILNLLSAAIGAQALIAVTGRTYVFDEANIPAPNPCVPSTYSLFDAQEAIKIAYDPNPSLFGESACFKIYDASLSPFLVFPEEKHYEDQFVAYHVFSEAERIVYENADDYYYTRFRPTSITAQVDEKLLDLLEADQVVISFARKACLPAIESQIIRRYYSHLISIYARYCLANKAKGAERVYGLILKERRSAILSVNAAFSTKLAMILSFLPKSIFSRILYTLEGRAMRQ